MQALTGNISAGIVKKHLILKVTASTATPENVQPNYYNWARRHVSLTTNFLFRHRNLPSVVVSQKHELAVWRPAPLLCITAQVTARYSHKVGELIIKSEEVNHSAFTNSSQYYIFRGLARGIQLRQNFFWQPICPPYFPQELVTHFIIIFTHMKTTASTKHLLTGLRFLIF